MARQGIVLKIEKKKMYVMTDEGEFVELPLPRVIPQLGSTVTISPPTNHTRSYRLALVAAILVIFISVGVFRPLLMPQAVAAVAFDLPIGLELGVDAENRIVDVRARDPFSENLARELNLKGRDIYSATNQVVQAACGGMNWDEGTGESAFMVTVMPLGRRGKMNLDRQLLQEQMMAELERQAFAGYLVVEESSEDLRQKAAQLNLPIGKYLLWERAEFKNIEELQDLPIDSFIPEDEDVLERRFPGMWCRIGERGAGHPNMPHHGEGNQPYDMPPNPSPNGGGTPPMGGRGPMHMHPGMGGMGRMHQR